LARIWTDERPPAWLPLAQRLTAALLQDDPTTEIRFLADPLSAPQLTHALPGATITPVDWSDVTTRIGNTRRDVAARLLQGGETDLEKSVADITQTALNGFTPDICFTVDNDPIFDRIAPTTTRLHVAPGLFRSAPLPATAALDPFGAGKRSAPARFAAEIAAKRRSNLDQDLIDSVRERLTLRLSGSVNPLASLLEDARRGMRGLIVALLDDVPVVRWGDRHPPQSPFEFIEGLLRTIPSDVLLAAPLEPGSDLLSTAELDVLRRAHPNFLADAAFSALTDPTLYLISQADAVIGFEDTRALQALLWRKPLITPPTGTWRAFAEADTLEAVESAIGRQTDNAATEHALAWLLTRYFLPADVLFDPKVLRGRLENAAPEETTATGVSWFYRTASSSQIDNAYRIGSATSALRADGLAQDHTVVLTAGRIGATTGGNGESAARLVRLALSPKAVTVPVPSDSEEDAGGLRLMIEGRWSTVLLHAVDVLNAEGEVLSRWSAEDDAAGTIAGVVIIPAPHLDAVLLERTTAPASLDLHWSGPPAYAVRVVISAPNDRTVQECRTTHWRTMAAIGTRHEEALARLSATVDSVSQTTRHTQSQMADFAGQMVDRVHEIEAGLVETMRGTRAELEGALLQQITDILDTRQSTWHAEVQESVRPVLERVSGLEAAVTGALHALRNDIQFAIVDQITAAIDAQSKSLERLQASQPNGAFEGRILELLETRMLAFQSRYEDESRALTAHVGDLDRRVNTSLEVLRADVGANIAQRISHELDDRMRSIALTMVEHFRSLNARLGLTSGAESPTLTGAVAALETRLADRLKVFAAEITGLNAAEERISIKLEDLAREQAFRFNELALNQSQVLQVIEAREERNAATARVVQTATMAVQMLEERLGDRLMVKLDEVMQEHAQAVQVLGGGMERQAAAVGAITDAVQTATLAMQTMEERLGERLTIKLDDVMQEHAHAVQVLEAGMERHAAAVSSVFRRLSHSETILLDIKRSYGADDLVANLRQDLAEATRKHDDALRMAERWRNEVDAIRQSTSWRITAPLRRAVETTRSVGPPRPAKG
jgi:hypothetical protein